MTSGLKTSLEQTFDFQLNNNQYQEIARLFHEIHKRDNLSAEDIVQSFKENEKINNSQGKNKFLAIKQSLIKLRFPLTSTEEKIKAQEVFLSELKAPVKPSIEPVKNFVPQKIFIEKSAKNSYLAKQFQERFPSVPVEVLEHSWEYVQKHKFKIADLKNPFVFIVQERWDFIKPCPCTKGHLGCNYWILNLGFGCPFDCSYCYLQQYANFPGIVLPANLDDFFNKFDDFYNKIKRPIRIGTGEFCDSLALDHITGYSQQLIEFFQDKPVLFELKTKSNNIANILKCQGRKNIIISWSLNPQEIIDSEEKCVASLSERLEAARQVKEKGFSLSFHFDPIIYSDNWASLYKEVIRELYAALDPEFKWISLGTLRGTRKLKNAAEQRFPDNAIWYGELLLGKDKKLRYPKFMRKSIYKYMVEWIRQFDSSTPLYLCMEDQDCWGQMDKPLTCEREVENYLLGN
ncbi:MAG: radical SAM protein [Candidatus Omnitrophota bacterium]